MWGFRKLQNRKSHGNSASEFSNSESAVLGLTDLAPQTHEADNYTSSSRYFDTDMLCTENYSYHDAI